jgi:hypothetical protein
MKSILSRLKENSSADLDELEDQARLCNKKWEFKIKGLYRNKIPEIANAEPMIILCFS